MGYNKTIQMCIFEGNPNGRILCELSNWDGRIYKISRSDLNEFSKRNDSEYTGIYFLFGKNSDNDETIYIGEAENIKERLVQHIRDYQSEKEKYYWNTAVVFIGRDLNKALIRYLENLHRPTHPRVKLEHS